MPKQNVLLYAFNRGLVSPLALSRLDLERLSLSAETYTNFRPRALGSMMLRPGRQYLGSVAGQSKLIPFVFSTDDTAIIEISNALMRVWVSDALVTRNAVTAAVANGSFTTDLTSWVDADDSGATSAWVTGGYLGLTGDGTNYARRTQQVTVTETGTEHAILVVVQRGPVVFRCGSSDQADDYVTETTLDTGYHSLAFTPTGDFHLTFQSNTKRQILVDSCTVESSGTMTVVAPWATADLNNIRYDQSGDIVYVACENYQQYKIERRSSTSWSVAKYYANDGPFRDENISSATIAASALTGNVTLTANENIFKSTNVGSLYRITSDGQVVTSSISSDNTFTSTIRVTGIETSRVFTITRSGTWSGTVTLQRSLTSSSGPWEDVTTYTTSATVSYDDSLDNIVAWYRIGVKTGDFTATTITNATQANPCQITAAGHGLETGENAGIAGVGGMTELNGNSSTITKVDADNFTLDGTDSTGYGAYTTGGTVTSEGPVTLTLTYPLGSIDGIVRITDYTSETSVDAEVIVDLGGTTAVDSWAEGAWSSRRGWPTAVVFAEGRLGWAGKGRIDLSVSDNYTSYDEDTVGDSAPIGRTIGSGPVDTINWLISVKRLLMGSEGSEIVCRTNGDDEPLTTSKFNMKTISTQGSNRVAARKVDNNAVFVQRGGIRLMEMAIGESLEYVTRDLSLFYPEIGSPGITHIAIQRQPDTRIHCLRSDGTVALLVYDSRENVLCWVEDTTSGTVEDIVILPGADGVGEDAVYYVVNYTINGSTVRYLEKHALESQCQGGTLNRQLDSFVTYSGVSTNSVTGATHLEGETVAVWGGGKDLGTYTVTSGAFTLSESVTDYVYGLAYTGQWKSSKLAYAAGHGTALTQKKRINQLGLVLYNTHYQGLQYGTSFSDLDNLPLISQGTALAADTIHATYDEEAFYLAGSWDTDSRLCLQAASPKPCTILAAVISVETHDKY